MNKKPEYRFYIKSENRMVEAIGFCFESETQIRIWYNKNQQILNESFACHNVEALPYTGLSDRYGTWIFVGDVVSVPYIDPTGKLCEDDENYRSEVHFNNGAFCIKSYSGYRFIALSDWCKPIGTEYVSNVGDVITYSDATYLTVLASIHTSPDLIK